MPRPYNSAHMANANRTTPPIALVVAMGEAREIGCAGRMPWHLPADLRHFKAVTTGYAVLMGRRTFESIGKPLPRRDNIVVSRDPAFKPPGCRVFASVEDALAAAPRDRTLMVVGGALLYAALLPLAETIHLTRIHANFPADTYFPELAEGEWQESDREDHSPDERNAYAYSFVTLRRRACARLPTRRTESS